MSYYSRRRKRFLKRLFIFVLVFCNPVAGLISGAWLFYHIPRYAPSGMQALLYPTWPGYFKSYWTLILKDDSNQDDVIDDTFPLLHQSSVKIPLILDHGPWIGSDESLPWYQWYKKIGLGKLTQEKTEDRSPIEAFKLILTPTGSMNILMQLGNHDGLNIQSFYNPWRQTHQLSITGNISKHGPHKTSFLKADNLRFYYGQEPSFLGLWLPSLVLKADTMSLNHNQTKIKGLQFNLHTSKQANKTSLFFDLDMRGFDLNKSRMHDVSLTCSIFDAASQPFNQLLMRHKQHIANKLFLKKSIEYRPFDFFKEIDVIDTDYYTCALSGTLDQLFLFEFSKQIKNQPSAALKGESRDLLFMIDLLDLDVSQETINIIRSKNQDIQLEWFADRGWILIESANTPNIDKLVLD
ncbi:hypothetical protein EBR43_01405 [bacterium]|nr:hypothetical protein [bacterium]NBW56445.1 hypothetical protein [bacterium]NBX71798.1 hypothetical protein [bacterium]